MSRIDDFYSRYDSEITESGKKRPPMPTPDIFPAPPESVGPIPTDTRTNANNVQQKGRNLGGNLTLGDATKYLQDSTKGYVQGFGENTFGGSQLPTTPGNPYSAVPSVTPGFDMSVPDIGGANAVNFDRDGGAAAVQPRDLTNNQPITGNEQQIKGASERPAKGTLSEALADTAGINSYMDKFNSGDPEMARRRAFLDAPDSLSGMKAVKAQQNMLSVGQKDYYHNDGNLTEMDSGDMRERLAGRMSADDLKNKYVKDITASTVETPNQAQDPAVIQEDTPTTKPSGNQTVSLDTVNQYLDNGNSEEYFRLLDSGQLTGR